MSAGRTTHGQASFGLRTSGVDILTILNFTEVPDVGLGDETWRWADMTFPLCFQFIKWAQTTEEQKYHRCSLNKYITWTQIMRRSCLCVRAHVSTPKLQNVVWLHLVLGEGLNPNLSSKHSTLVLTVQYNPILYMKLTSNFIYYFFQNSSLYKTCLGTTQHKT